MKPAIPTLYRHFKGGYYLLVCYAIDEATGEVLVVYQSLSDGKVWSRPLSVFIEDVPKDKVNPTGQQKRFEQVIKF